MRHKTKFKHEKVEEGRARGEVGIYETIRSQVTTSPCLTQPSVRVKTEEVIESKHGTAFIKLFALQSALRFVMLS